MKTHSFLSEIRLIWCGDGFVLIFFITSLQPRIMSRGECVNNGKRGECCTNFYPSNGECIACPAGSYGDNCSTTCPYPSYGENCGHQCDCSPGEECSPFKGCVKITTAPPPSTANHRNSNTESIPNISIKPGKDKKSTQNFKAETKHVTDNSKINLEIRSTVSHGDFVKTTTETTSGNSQTMLVIIITGSVLSLFLIIIIINQIHGKLRKQRERKSTNKKSNPEVPNHPEEEAYVEINESGLLGNISNYDKMESQSSVKRLKRNDEMFEVIKDDVAKPMLPGGRDQLIEIKSKDSIVEEGRCLGDEHPSSYLDVISVNPNESPDNSYLKPVGKMNVYTGVIGSPPKELTHSESNISNESKGSHDSNSVCINGQRSLEGTYLEVVHQ
ncbi:uncharacterized protein LOC134269985 isoform X2 [Saccostrea cucullata]|uniref:uncharacterized protein LOC134269985 isoform X2 n=1 Tax=Saccostrea cuccullata TaxID=36930 RepID=UPI002ED61E79